LHNITPSSGGTERSVVIDCSDLLYGFLINFGVIEMNWNHRIVRHEDDKEKLYGIHEVYYNDKGEICSMTVDPVLPCGSTVPDLRKNYELMKSAFDRAPIKYDRKFATAEWDKKKKVTE
jgi:hypothetical protein